MCDEEKLVSAPETDAETVQRPDGEAEVNWAEEAKKYRDLYLRGAAEMENMRRRFQKEREEQARYAGERIIRGLLPVMDNLEMALAYIKEDAPEETLCLAEGIRLTIKGLQDLLADNGVKSIEAERGQVFDPNIHEALGQLPENEMAPGTVCQMVQRGYSLNDRLVRPAKVMVSSPGGC